jgi:hypothetical protein
MTFISNLSFDNSQQIKLIEKVSFNIHHDFLNKNHRFSEILNLILQLWRTGIR